MHGGYSGPELDLGLERGEIDGRAIAVDTVSMTEGYKKLVDFHAILEIPKGHRPREFANLPEIEVFAWSQIERQVLTMSRVFWGVGTLIYLPPGTPEKLVEILRQAFRSSFEDRQFHEQYKKLLGLHPTPLMPEDQQKLVAELPRDIEVVKFLKPSPEWIPFQRAGNDRIRDDEGVKPLTSGSGRKPMQTKR